MKLQQTFVYPWLQMDPDGAHVAHDLTGRFFEGKVKYPLAAAAGGIGKVRGETALAGAGRAGDQHAASSEVALATQHRVKTRNAGGNAFVGNVVLQGERSDGQHRNSVFVDQEWILVGAVSRTAILDHAQASR